MHSPATAVPAGTASGGSGRIPFESPVPLVQQFIQLLNKYDHHIWVFVMLGVEDFVAQIKESCPFGLGH